MANLLLKKRILINSGASAAQVFISGLSIFALYKYLLGVFGIKYLGIWSVILSFISLTKISEFGLSDTVIRYVAKYNALNDYESSSCVVRTVVVTIAVILGITILCSYYIFSRIIPKIFPLSDAHIAQTILPYTLISGWVSSVSNVYLSVLDGCQRIEIRSAVISIGNILFFILSVLFVQHYGFLGIAYAQLLNNAILLIISICLVAKVLPNAILKPIGWKINIFREIIGYGVGFQLMAFIGMIRDPLIKALLTKFGGLDHVGFYEMANKMVFYIRDILINANRALVPTFSAIATKMPDRIKDLYSESYRMMVYLSIPVFSIVLVIIPLISQIWIGQRNYEFINFSLILSIGWFVNTISCPVYIVNLGTGELFWNIMSHIISTFLGTFLCIILGLYHGGFGIIWGSSIAILLSGLILILSFHFNYNLNTIKILNFRDAYFAIGIIIYTSISVLLYIRNNISLSNGILLYINIFYVVILGIYFCFHPVTRRLYSIIKSIGCKHTGEI